MKLFRESEQQEGGWRGPNGLVCWVDDDEQEGEKEVVRFR